MTQSNPIISVTMTTYNHEKYIGEAIESILNQTFSNFELIIVNDGSNDRTHEIIQQFKDERITYIYQENQGTSRALNRAILASRGKYVAFMSGDDICYPNRLAIQYNYLLNSGQKIVFSWVEFIDDNSNIHLGEHISKTSSNHPNRSRTEILRYLFFNCNYINAVTGFIIRDLLVDAGLFNLASLQLQDFEMWIKLVKKYEIHILPEKLIKYRIRDNQANLCMNPANQPRTEFELYQIYKDIFNNVSVEMFKQSFSNEIRNINFSGHIEYKLEQAFIYLKHNLHYIRAVGAEKLFRLLQNEQILNIAQQKYNFSLTEFYSITKNLDFINSKNLWQAYQALQQYQLLLENTQEQLRRLQLRENLKQSLHLRDTNFIIFPDPEQSEQSIYEELVRVISSLENHPDCGKMTLLVNAGKFPPHLTQAFTEQLCEEEEEGLQISVVGKLSPLEWEALLPQVTGRIVLAQEDGESMGQLPMDQVPLVTVDGFVDG
ncbi:glycosyltransferase [Anabaenopsis sp. FSS-46]|uniref:glycosyltransferase family 2 protein n=1 Tax=Anabaenopsis sp. FSS-46 TaxID=2971766 RepID=UPI002473E26D|nr:glycosyltransferase [Anabaenopsis sp. FSS-46]MDH6099002.1 glycosyltransferase [Anabaenopsis sp. FSS-46]